MQPTSQMMVSYSQSVQATKSTSMIYVVLPHSEEVVHPLKWMHRLMGTAQFIMMNFLAVQFAKTIKPAKNVCLVII